MNKNTTTKTPEQLRNRVVEAFYGWHHHKADFFTVQAAVKEAGMSQEEASAICDEVAEWVSNND